MRNWKKLAKKGSVYCWLKLSFRSKLFISTVVCICIMAVAIKHESYTSVSISISQVELSSYFKASASVNSEDGFQPVSSDKTTFVFSAYYELRSRKIRVIAVTKNKWAELFCLVKFKSTGKTQPSFTAVRAFVANINEEHGKEYTAAYILCYLPIDGVPEFVSVTDKQNVDKTYNILPVKVLRSYEKQIDFTVCVSPMHSGYNNAIGLIEWIELNKIVGVQKFIIYVHSISSRTEKVLTYYQSKGLVDVVPWHISDDLCMPDIRLHYCGQLAALNDCLYRSKGHTKYIAAFDIDEFIIPQSDYDYTWCDIFKKLPEESAYIFRNVFFFQDQMFLYNVSVSELVTLSWTSKEDFIHGSHDRSKVIARTDIMVTFGIHNVWAMKEGEEYTVDANVALVHHYRTTAVEYPDSVTVKSIHSSIMNKFAKALIGNVTLAKNAVGF